MKTTKRNHGSPWTLQELEYVEKHYSKMSCADIGEHLGRSANAVRTIAQKLGCAPQKTPDWSDKEMKVIVDDSAQYPDWSNRDDIKAKLKVDLILLLHRYGFPPVANDEVYKSVLEQAENFKKYQQS
ncbi:hypothetical protein YERSI8AC_170033 [Enterobacterales bacterium 8AC]|nr:hypothetical protein YERSI8AC_170033 [Enterobacterales bacterium 8AC]